MTTAIINRIRMPKPRAAFSATLNMWKPESLKASFICASISESSFASSFASICVWTLAVGENNVLPIVKQMYAGVEKFLAIGLQVRMLFLSVFLVVGVAVVVEVVKVVVVKGVVVLGEVLVTMALWVGLAL